MALPIIEEPIYGQMTLETAAWASTFTWVDRTADIAQGINYSEGGRVSAPGQPRTDVGTLNVTFKNVATAPVVGDLVRLRRTGTTEYAFTGYVQDVSQSIVFDQSVSYTTPITLTTINCLDWVGYISQFQIEGVGGAVPATGVADTTSNYSWERRVAALHMAIDPTYATKIIAYTFAGAGVTLGDTDMVGTLSNHLDLMANTEDLHWYGVHVLPTNKTTGRTGLVHVRYSPASSGKTFTDVAGTAGQLHYTEIDFASSSANVANTIVGINRSRLQINDSEVTQIGGFNQENFMLINGVETTGVALDQTFKGSSSTSITTYGNRQAEIETNSSYALSTIEANLFANPSVEYSDTGWGGSNLRVNRRKPSENSTPFAAAHGDWSLRGRVSAAVASPSMGFGGSESDGVPVVAGRSYMAQAKAMRGVPNRTDARVRAYIQWFNEAGGVISTSFGSQVTLPGGYSWQPCSVTAVAPAGAERANIGLDFNRSGGGVFTVGDIFWGDEFMLSKTAVTSPITYFDGDTVLDANNIYCWTGGLGLSPSYKVTNQIDSSINNFLTRYATTSNRITRIRWNAQEDMTAISSMYVGSSINVIYKGTTTTHRIIGIDGNVSPDRYMIDYYLEKV